MRTVNRVGDTRRVKRFAWFPFDIVQKDGSVVEVWLENYWEIQEFSSVRDHRLRDFYDWRCIKEELCN